ncbi:MAG: universal stress protein [Spirochaetales bacterium]|nr:universal stress protein [Spirochaetales bacterium]
MEGPIKKVMVYIDGTEQSITAAQYAICLCRSTGAELTALFVINSRALNDLVKARIFLQEEQEEYRRDLESDAEKYLNHVRTMARQKGLVIETISTSGTVHQEIKTKISELDIDLLVIGELSRIRSRRDELHNEAERAMRNASCSVLIVKDEDRIWDLFERLV